MDPDSPPPQASPSLLRWTLGFLLVGVAWGFTTPFIRRAAIDHRPRAHPILESPSLGMVRRKALEVWFKVMDMLRNPRYAVPLLINITGSVWFFVLIGQAGRCCRGLLLEVLRWALRMWGRRHPDIVSSCHRR